MTRRDTPRGLDGLIRALRAAAAIAAFALASGCATLPPNVGQDPRDPWEAFNRNVFVFNQAFDADIMKPLAEHYLLLPDFIRDCLSNAFANLRGPSNAINNTLQGKPVEAASDLGRFVINSTIGLVGCIDVATPMGLEKSDEDFGQTLGVWGFGPGPYLIVPFLGPSNVRDAVGILAVEPFLDLNFYIDNAAVEYSIFALRLINVRAQLISAESLIDQAALDRYTFIRDAFLQRRRYLIYDGNPPRDIDPDDDDADSAPAKEAVAPAPRPAPDAPAKAAEQPKS